MDCELMAFGVTKLHVDFLPQIKKEEGKSSQQFGPRGEETTMKFSVNFAVHKDNERQFQITLGAKFSEHTKENVPLGYLVEVGVIGVVVVSKDVDSEKVAKVAQLNGVNLLYGTMRGIVLNATGGFVAGPLMTKSLTAQEILGTLIKAPESKPEPTQVIPKSSKRPVRNRPSPTQEGVSSAQSVLRKVLAKADPARPKKT